MNIETEYGRDDVRDIISGFQDFARRELISVTGMEGEKASIKRKRAWEAFAGAGWLEIANGAFAQRDSMLGLVLVHEELGRMASTLPVLGVHHAILLLGQDPRDERVSAILDGICQGTIIPATPWVSTTGYLDESAAQAAARGAVGVGLATHVLTFGPSNTNLRFFQIGEEGVRANVSTQNSGLGVGEIVVPIEANGELLSFDADVGFRVSSSLSMSKVFLAATLAGLSSSVLEISIRYAKDRVQFGHPIGSFQAIQHKLADMRLMVDQTTAVTHRAGALMQSNNPRGESYAEQALASALRTNRRVTFEGHQILAGVGFMLEHPMHVYTFLGELLSTLFGSQTLAGSVSPVSTMTQ